MSPSMSLCSSCFTAGNHEGHDFNKFKSHAGGACDCGDATVMKESGYISYFVLFYSMYSSIDYQFIDLFSSEFMDVVCRYWID